MHIDMTAPSLSSKVYNRNLVKSRSMEAEITETRKSTIAAAIPTSMVHTRNHFLDLDFGELKKVYIIRTEDKEDSTSAAMETDSKGSGIQLEL